jgi:predicted cupin superfamily sugar epimerase
MRARQLIDALGLRPHPEGGWFKEIFRSAAQVLPADGRPARDALTTIYFLLRAGEHSRWHRVRSDEVWIYLEGAPLALWTSDAALRTAPAHLRLGPVDVHGTRPQHTVPAGQWQAARPIIGSAGNSESDDQAAGNDFTLVSCTVGPGFDFDDFAFMQPDGDEAALMRHHWPELAALI